MTTIAPDAPTRPHLPIDPRIHQRLVEVRRAESRRRLRILLAVSGAVALAAGALGVLHTPLVKVRHTRIAGTGSLSRAQVLAVSGLAHQGLMVDVHPAADARRLEEEIAVVGTASVSRQWPATVRVSLTLRTPVGVVVTPTQRLVVDRTGRVLQAGSQAGAGLPVLSLAVPAPPAPGAWLPGAPGLTGLAGTVPPAVARSSPVDEELAVAAALSPELRPVVASEAVLVGDGLTLTVGPTQVVLGDASQLAAKVVALEALLRDGALATTVRADLRVPDRPAVTPAHGSAGRS